jgi:biotin synthase
MRVCCGGIVGMGETRAHRAGLLHTLATLPAHPESLPINALAPIPGTPLGQSPPIDGLEFVRTVAVARILCPRSVVRLAAGREGMSRELQAMCFLAGANSIFIGARLLTTPLPGEDKDRALLADLGMRAMGEERSPADRRNDWSIGAEMSRGQVADLVDATGIEPVTPSV